MKGIQVWHFLFITLIDAANTPATNTTNKSQTMNSNTP